MDKSSRLNIEIEDQRAMWNRWNAAAREKAQGEVSLLQARWVEKCLCTMQRKDLDLIDVGFGTGWMSERLSRWGRVTGIDLADEVVQRAQQRLPHIRFLVGDLMALPLESESFDVAVSLEVLSHVAEQRAFLALTARILRPGGVRHGNDGVIRSFKGGEHHPDERENGNDRHRAQNHYTTWHCQETGG